MRRGAVVFRVIVMMEDNLVPTAERVKVMDMMLATLALTGDNGTICGAPFTIIPPRLFHRLSFFLDPEEIKSNKTNKRTTLKRLPMVAPRVYHGEYTLQETVILTQLNLNMQARDLERMVNGAPREVPQIVPLFPRPLLLACPMRGTWAGGCVRG